MKKLTLSFLLLCFISFSVNSQSKRDQKFMIKGISLEDAKAVSMVTLEEFLQVNLMSLKKTSNKNLIATLRPYNFKTNNYKYKIDLYFEYLPTGLLIKAKNLHFFDTKQNKYVPTLIDIKHVGIKAALRKDILKYCNDVYTNPEKLERGRSLVNGKSSVTSSNNVTKPSKKSNASYTRKGIQFDVPQDVFLAGGFIDVIYSQQLFAKSTDYIYIVEPYTPKGKAIRNSNKTLGSKTIYNNNAGKVSLKLPNKPGVYDIRYAVYKYNAIDDEVAFKTINVVMPETEISLNKTNFAPGQEIRANWSTELDLPLTSTISLVPTDVPHGSNRENNKHKLQSSYIKGKKGLATFKAPTTEGTYTIRLSDYRSDNELKSVDFTVSNSTVELRLEKKIFKPNEKIKVYYSTSAISKNQAWVGILPSDIPHGNTSENKKHWISSDDVTGKKEAIIYLNAPKNPGKYDIRMNLYGSGGYQSSGTELASVTIDVASNGKVLDKSSFNYSSLDNISSKLAQGKSVTDEKVILKDINFNTGSSQLTTQSKTNLKKLIFLLEKHPNLKLEISGHTDASGNANTNLKLSKERAKSVVLHLIMNNVNPSNLSYEGYGQSVPIGDNKTSQGRLKNRRVELKIVGQ